MPTPSGTAASACDRLHAALPGRLEKLARRPTMPASPLTAAWGDPAVVLRCGVARPAGYTPGASVLTVDGVGWFQQVEGSTVRWTAVDLPAYVELSVPTDYPSDAYLVDVGGLLRRTMPGSS